MTQKIINTGTADKGNGDPIRTAFTKVNENFTELYNSVSAVVVTGATAPTSPGVGDLWWDTESGRMYVYYGTSWVDASPVDGTGISSTNELVNGNKTVSLASTGILTLPSSSYLESTDVNLKVGAQGTVTIRSNAESNLTTREWEFDRSGTLTVPNLFPATFTAIVDSAHYYGEGSLTLEGNAWSFEVSFVLNANGTVETQITNNTPWPSNPGYIDGLEFRFVEEDHGIPGYTFILTLTDIQNPGPMMYTTNLAASIPPTLPSTISSPETIKLTADATSWTFGADGTLTVPGAIKFPTGTGESAVIYGNTELIGLLASPTSNSGLEIAGGVSSDLYNTGRVRISSNFNQEEGGTKSWDFNANGTLTFPDNTVQTTAFTGTAAPNNITNSAGPSATIAVGGFAATRDHLSVRVTNNSNTLDVEINYSNPDSQALISVYRVYPGEGNLFGRTLKAANNTTWDLVTNLPAEGDSLSFTVTDHSYLKIYRVTVIADVMPGVPIAGEAFCVIEELK